MNEAGVHRWHQLSKDRIHTSSITVACFLGETDNIANGNSLLKEEDLEEQFTRGSGAGGQHRNKTSTAVILKHIPTGITIRAEGERSQKQNRETARELLLSKLKEKEERSSFNKQVSDRRQQIGVGMHGDRQRVVMTQHGKVVNEVTGKSCSFKDYSKGKLSLLW